MVYDAVGGVTTPSALAALAHRGRLVVISAVGSPNVTVNLLDLYHNETRILGTDSGKLSVVDSARRLDAMAPYFESGQFRPLPIAATYPLDDAADRIPGRRRPHRRARRDSALTSQMRREASTCHPT